jgi:hypothetical protein
MDGFVFFYMALYGPRWLPIEPDGFLWVHMATYVLEAHPFVLDGCLCVPRVTISEDKKKYSSRSDFGNF